MPRNKKTLVPEAKGELDKMKNEVAAEQGVDLKEGYNGDMTAHDAGKIGGNMVKKLVRKAEEDMSQGKKS